MSVEGQSEHFVVLLVWLFYHSAGHFEGYGMWKSMFPCCFKYR